MGRPKPRRHGFDMSSRAERAMREYDNFAGSNDDDPERAKRFYARHNALKACIAHIHALNQIEGGSTEERGDPTAMVARARAALAQERTADESEAED